MDREGLRILPQVNPHRWAISLSGMVCNASFVTNPLLNSLRKCSQVSEGDMLLITWNRGDVEEDGVMAGTTSGVL